MITAEEGRYLPRKLTPWLLFLLCLGLLAMSATRFGSLADHAFVAFRIAILVFLSAHVLWRWFAELV